MTSKRGKSSNISRKTAPNIIQDIHHRYPIVAKIDNIKYIKIDAEMNKNCVKLI